LGFEKLGQNQSIVQWIDVTGKVIKYTIDKPL